MYTFAYEYPTHYQIIVTDGTEKGSFVYDFSKEQDVVVSEKEAKLLAQFELDQRQTPIPVAI
jgi:hypothetical protein